MGTHKVKNIMKLQVLFSAAVTAVTISKPHANNFLQRFRRANEGYFSELTSGNLERECVEETCDQTEFYEVYDDDEVSAPLYTVYLDCKNYIRWDKDDQLSINSLRDCLIERKQSNGQVTQKPMTPKSTQQVQLTPAKDTLPCDSRQNSYTCQRPLNGNGYNDPTDTLFAVEVGPRLEANHVNTVRCDRSAMNYACTVTYERTQSTKFTTSTVYCTSVVTISTCSSRQPRDAQYNQCQSNQIQLENIDQTVCRDY